MYSPACSQSLAPTINVWQESFTDCVFIIAYNTSLKALLDETCKTH